MKETYKIAIKAAIEGGHEILNIYDRPKIQVEIKEDASPLTLADKAANDKINALLENTEHPIISEENKLLAYDIRKDWETCWMVDPLDGTKEFIKKNGEFTVNIALIKNGEPRFGVIYVPVSRELYYANVSDGKAFKTVLDTDHRIPTTLGREKDRIQPVTAKKELVKIVGSRSHMNQDTLNYMESLKKDYQNIEVVSKGSSLKFCLVAEGKAHIYPRFAPTMEWDTAAGHAICKAVGIRVISNETKTEMRYNKENLLNNHFLVKG